jgi:hypothetical protein
VAGLRGRQRGGDGLVTRGARHGLAEIDVTRLVAGGVGIRQVVGDQFATARAHVERCGVYAYVLVQVQGHRLLLVSAIRHGG